MSTRYEYQGHPYHLVEPSPWPLLTSAALLTLTSSGVMYFHGYANALVFVTLGFFTTLFVMILWFRDVSAEGAYLGNHTFAVQKGLSLGVALFIVSEVFFFLSFFWAFFHSALAPTVELGAHWPPVGIEALSPYEVPLANTIILLSSGAAVTYAHHSLIQGNRHCRRSIWCYIFYGNRIPRAPCHYWNTIHYGCILPNLVLPID